MDTARLEPCPSGDPLEELAVRTYTAVRGGVGHLARVELHVGENHTERWWAISVSGKQGPSQLRLIWAAPLAPSSELGIGLVASWNDPRFPHGRVWVADGLCDRDEPANPLRGRPRGARRLAELSGAQLLERGVAYAVTVAVCFVTSGLRLSEPAQRLLGPNLLEGMVLGPKAPPPRFPPVLDAHGAPAGRGQPEPLPASTAGWWLPGTSLAALADELGCEVEVLRGALEQRGLPVEEGAVAGLAGLDETTLAACAAAGVSPTTLARLVGVSAHTVAHWWRARGLPSRQGPGRRRAHPLLDDRAWLAEQLQAREATLGQVAELLEVSDDTVARARDRCGIELPADEARTRANVPELRDANWLADLLRQGLSDEDIAQRLRCHPDTVAYWVERYGLRAG
jgi:transposase